MGVKGFGWLWRPAMGLKGLGWVWRAWDGFKELEVGVEGLRWV